MGNCGALRLAPILRKLTGVEVEVAAWTSVDAVERLDPDLVYVDLFGFDVVAQACVAAVTGRSLPAHDLAPLRAVVAALVDRPVVYRGVRRPAAGAFDLLDGHAELDAWFDALESVVAGQRVLDVQGLWARNGIPTDDVVGGLGHGEPLGGGDAADAEPGAVSAAMFQEARWVESLWASRALPPLECVVVDLELLIRGKLVDEDFSRLNPAWAPQDEVADPAPPLEAWWSMGRGLHEALHIVRRRGIALALVSEHDAADVARRFRRRALDVSNDAGRFSWMYDPLPESMRSAAFAAHPQLVNDLALDAEDFAVVEGGAGLMSDKCLRVAERLGLTPFSLSFLGASGSDRELVRQKVPGITVPEGPPHRIREFLLHGARLSRWPEPTAPAPRAAPSAAEPVPGVDATLHDLELAVGVRPATPRDYAEIEALLVLSREMNLTGARPLLTDVEAIYVGTCRDRTRDYGIVCAGLFDRNRLLNWVCSCQVLPHRIAGTLLHLMLKANPGVSAEYIDFGLNTLATSIITEARAGVAPWVLVTAEPAAQRASTSP